MGLLAGTIFDREPHCERCDKPESQCTCPPLPVASTLLPPGKQTARLAIEKRKNGKKVSVIRGLSPTECDLPALLSRLKTTLGTGGAIVEDELEIQGEQLERLRQVLNQLGYKVKG